MSWIEDNKTLTGLIAAALLHFGGFVWSYLNLKRDVLELKEKHKAAHDDQTEIFERLNDIGQDVSYVRGVLETMQRQGK